MNGMPAEDLYDADFFAWTQLQARELRRFARTRPNVGLDLGHIAEEIQDLGREQRNALRSWTVRLIEHLLLLQYSPADEPRRGWEREIRNFRREMYWRKTATLKRDLDRRLPRLYEEARRALASDFERHGEADVAERIPYSLDQILDSFWPERYPSDKDT